MTRNYRQRSRATARESAFTIIELLIAVVVIAVLATIAFVAYQGAQDRAETAALESDLTQASKQLSMSKVTEGSFPSGDGTPPESLTSSIGTTFEYTSDGTSFCLSATKGSKGNHVTNSGSPKDGVCPGHSGPGSGGSLEPENYEVGDRGPAGGVVFYDKGFVSDGWRYLEAANRGSGDTNKYTWGCFFFDESMEVEGADGVALGTGKQNTADIEADGCNSPVVELIQGYSQGGYADWFLPSKDELNELYRQKDVIGDLTADYYWSSSEVSNQSVWQQSFVNGYQRTINKFFLSTFHFRPIRSF